MAAPGISGSGPRLLRPRVPAPAPCPAWVPQASGAACWRTERRGAASPWERRTQRKAPSNLVRSAAAQTGHNNTFLVCLNPSMLARRGQCSLRSALGRWKLKLLLAAEPASRESEQLALSRQFLNSFLETRNLTKQKRSAHDPYACSPPVLGVFEAAGSGPPSPSFPLSRPAYLGSRLAAALAAWSSQCRPRRRRAELFVRPGRERAIPEGSEPQTPLCEVQRQRERCVGPGSFIYSVKAPRINMKNAYQLSKYVFT